MAPRIFFNGRFSLVLHLPGFFFYFGTIILPVIKLIVPYLSSYSFTSLFLNRVFLYYLLLPFLYTQYITFYCIRPRLFFVVVVVGIFAIALKVLQNVSSKNIIAGVNNTNVVFVSFGTVVKPIGVGFVRRCACVCVCVCLTLLVN